MKDKKFGNPDVKETARELTEAERRRLERFEALAEKMKAEGYRRTDLTISIVGRKPFPSLPEDSQQILAHKPVR